MVRECILHVFMSTSMYSFYMYMYIIKYSSLMYLVYNNHVLGHCDTVRGDRSAYSGQLYDCTCHGGQLNSATVIALAG